MVLVVLAEDLSGQETKELKSCSFLSFDCKCRAELSRTNRTKSSGLNWTAVSLVILVAPGCEAMKSSTRHVRTLAPGGHRNGAFVVTPSV